MFFLKNHANNEKEGLVPELYLLFFFKKIYLREKWYAA